MKTRCAAGAAPDRSGHQFSGSVRHHRRESDAHARTNTCAWSRSPCRKPKGKRPRAGRRRRLQHAEVIDLAKEVKRIGADGILSVTPYYNKPTQEGLYQHYKAIAAAIDLPIVVYSVQGRTGVNVEPATLKRLAEIDNIVGVKEASGNIGQMATIVQQVPERFTVLSRRRCDHACRSSRSADGGDLGGLE